MQDLMTLASYIRRHLPKDKSEVFTTKFNKFVGETNKQSIDIKRTLWEKWVFDSLLRGI